MVSVMYLMTTKTAMVLRTLQKSAPLSEPKQIMQTQTATAFATDLRHLPTAVAWLDPTPSRSTLQQRATPMATVCPMNCWVPLLPTLLWLRTWTMTTILGWITWNCFAALTRSQSLILQPIRMATVPAMLWTTISTCHSHSIIRRNMSICL